MKMKMLSFDLFYRIELKGGNLYTYNNRYKLFLKKMVNHLKMIHIHSDHYGNIEN